MNSYSLHVSGFCSTYTSAIRQYNIFARKCYFNFYGRYGFEIETTLPTLAQTVRYIVFNAWPTSTVISGRSKYSMKLPNTTSNTKNQSNRSATRPGKYSSLKSNFSFLKHACAIDLPKEVSRLQVISDSLLLTHIT